MGKKISNGIRKRGNAFRIPWRVGAKCFRKKIRFFLVLALSSLKFRRKKSRSSKVVGLRRKCFKRLKF